ncbi:MAG: heavy metal translocating P-type ATPase [Candidatus Hydrogenedentales bacterium]
MPQQTFKIRGMDCAEEVAVLKAAVGPLAGGDDQLAFDLLNGKMTVTRDGVDPAKVVEAVRRTGMNAVPWEEHVARTKTGGGENIWDRHSRMIMAASSGILLLAATVWHVGGHGWADAFGGHLEAHTYPWPVIALYLAVVITGGWFVFPKALFAARRLRPDMNLLMTVAVIGAILIGEWFEAGAVAFLFAVALLLESWSVGRARRAIGALMDLSPTVARYRCPHDGDIEEKPVADVPLGVSVLVRPGEKIPLDGEVTVGSTTVNQSAITGESVPVAKEPGDEVFAGTLNEDGAIEFRVTRAAEDTTLARIIHMVEQAQARRAPSEQWVEKFARVYTPAMMALALAVAVVPPLFTGEWAHWFYEALVILVIACPCALVISTPVSIVSGLTAAARNGVLIKGGIHLETPASLRAIAFDKTGTVTYGRPAVQRIIPLNGHNETELLERAAALESHSTHPLAMAILQRARDAGVAHATAHNVQNVQGKGAEGVFDGRSFWIGSHRFLHEKGGETPETHDKAVALEDAGHSVIAIGNEAHICGLLSVADEVRADSSAVVKALKDAGIEHVTLLTGDNEGTAAAVAAAIDVDSYQSELLPEEKVAAVEQLVAKYKKVAMVGDGINDAPAMAASTLAIAMGAVGTDAAIETADVALMSDDLSRLPWLIGHSRRTLRIIKQNIAFALGLKLVFIVLAFAGLATLWMAIAADMGASLLVIFNALRLLRA